MKPKTKASKTPAISRAKPAKKKRRVLGLKPENVLARFTPNCRPSRINAAFAERWVWWWRRVPHMVQVFKAKTAPLKKGESIKLSREDEFAYWLISLTKQPQWGITIEALFQSELEHRIDGGKNCKNLPRIHFELLTPRAKDMAKPFETPVSVAIKLPANLPKKKAQELLYSAYTKAQSLAGIERKKHTADNALKAWINGGPSPFRVLEIIDREVWGLGVDSDEFAQVRRLFREQKLVRGWRE